MTVVRTRRQPPLREQTARGGPRAVTCVCAPASDTIAMLTSIVWRCPKMGMTEIGAPD
jgi:hypothetical protein